MDFNNNLYKKQIKQFLNKELNKISIDKEVYESAYML